MFLSPIRIALSLSAALGIASFASLGQAQTDHSAHAAAKPAPASTAATAMEEGVVKKIDKPASKITLSHGVLKSGMSAMTMSYPVKDAALLDKIQVGQKIRFATDPSGRAVVGIEAAKP